MGFKNLNLEVTHAVTLGATLCILLLIACDTDHVLVTWYETPVADWLPTFLAAETLLVPLLPHVLKLLHSCHIHTFSICTIGGLVV